MHHHQKLLLWNQISIQNNNNNNNINNNKNKQKIPENTDGMILSKPEKTG